MARAPARLAPSIKVWLRGFGADCVTANLLALRVRLKNLRPSSLLMMAWNVSFWLGRHHPLGFPRTITELIRTTRRTAGFAKIRRAFVMATWSISIAREDSRMKPRQAISQINSDRREDKLDLSG